MDGIVIHEGLPDADLEQPLLVAIDSMPDEPAAATDRLDGVTVTAHTPAWVTEKLSRRSSRWQFGMMCPDWLTPSG